MIMSMTSIRTDCEFHTAEMPFNVDSNIEQKYFGLCDTHQFMLALVVWVCTIPTIRSVEFGKVA